MFRTSPLNNPASSRRDNARCGKMLRTTLGFARNLPMTWRQIQPTMEMIFRIRPPAGDFP
jgi:hypothetical protein